MKFYPLIYVTMLCGRAPHGARGLKWQRDGMHHRMKRSRPTRGAWIEIVEDLPAVLKPVVAPHTGRVD